MEKILHGLTFYQKKRLYTVTTKDSFHPSLFLDPLMIDSFKQTKIISLTQSFDNILVTGYGLVKIQMIHVMMRSAHTINYK